MGRPQIHDGKWDANDRKELNYIRLNRLSVEPNGGIGCALCLCSFLNLDTSEADEQLLRLTIHFKVSNSLRKSNLFLEAN